MQTEYSYEFMVSRNDPFGFALRTRKNLDAILHAHKRGEDVHPVTQVVSSLVGIVVFPWNHDPIGEHIKDRRLADVFPNSEFKLTVDLGKINTIGQLWRTIRNAVSHRRVVFSNDSRELNEVEVTFFDGHWNRQQKTLDERVRIRLTGDQLLIFCYAILELIDEYK
ncbi:HEPN family nuclease [Tateyamaria sp. SN3-11]|uniref:HEPN family nuclease n=1 Tax=Tateyamaria sp. SN3-11 TaxID=3092147 RepID=UPI0039ECC16F